MLRSATYLERRVVGFTARLRYQKLDIGVGHTRVDHSTSVSNAPRWRHGLVTHFRACEKGNAESDDMSRCTFAWFAVPMALSRGSEGSLDKGLRQPLCVRTPHLSAIRSGAKSTIGTRPRQIPPGSSSFAAATALWDPLRAACFANNSATTLEEHGLVVTSVHLRTKQHLDGHSLEVSIPLSDCALKYISTI